MQNPRIYLAIDNCFASKRWTKPSEWMKVIKELGIKYIEASADTECDPLYHGYDYLIEWAEEVKNYEKIYDVKVANLYSGHGTYATLGLAHTDESIRKRFMEKWLKPMLMTADYTGAGLGFFCHAFSQSVLNNRELYLKAEEDLYNSLADLAAHASLKGVEPAGVEQMYTPHQIPWTIKGASRLLREVYKRGKSPFYITIDVGHQTGQRCFLKPESGQIREALKLSQNGIKLEGFWLGPESAKTLFKNALCRSENDDEGNIRLIELEMEKYPFLFANYEDGNPYLWLEALGCYSPIVHLQQITGSRSAHLPFTEENNENGIIKGEEILKAIAASYALPIKADMPPRCKDIYLTLEIFSGTSETTDDIIEKLKASVEYWRKFIPFDGADLNTMLNWNRR